MRDRSRRGVAAFWVLVPGCRFDPPSPPTRPTSTTRSPAPTVGGTYTGFGYADTSNTARATAGDTSFLNGLIGITQKTTSGVTTSYIRDPSGTLIAIRLNQVSSYYTTDVLGSVIYLSPGNNGNPTRYTYDANGNTTTATGDLAAVNPYCYAGGYYDQDTGLTKMGARYYSAALGRFTQLDPSGQDDHYLYGDNNPISNTDPTGLITQNELSAAVGIGLGLIGLTAGVAFNLTGTIAAAAFSAGVGTLIECAFGCDDGIIKTALKMPYLGTHSCHIW